MLTREMITFEKIKKSYLDKNYVWNEKPFELNVGAYRSKDNTPDAFNDFLFVAYIDDKKVEQLFVFQGTTDPGTYWLTHPMNESGCFVMIPDQYMKSHRLGLHLGKIRAMVQCGKLKGWRDNNRDKIVDHDCKEIFEGSDFGVNIHPMGDKLTIIYNWSAGCQGGSTADVEHLCDLVVTQKKNVGHDFINYTLFVEEDLAV